MVEEDEESSGRVESPPSGAGGLQALRSTLRFTRERMGAARGLQVLRRLNQSEGFDCPGCAWPDPARRSAAEFCENGVKHVAHEATRARADRKFFARHGLEDLAARSDRWLEAQGRICEPMIKRCGNDHYEPLGWDEAFLRVAEVLGSLKSPERALFYTSGRTSNEAAFLYQLFARCFGTNNLPDCSNLCHESSGFALKQAIGVGKGTVSLEDFEHADLILVMGQNPGSNHPRMLATLQAAARRGAEVVAINPLREVGLVRFGHPKEALALLGRADPIASHFVPVRLGGDVALLKGLAREVLEAESESPGSILDWDFIREKTQGFEAWRDALLGESWAEIVSASGIERKAIRELADRFLRAERVIVCWAMGLTQHEFGVANVQEIVNLLLLRGQIGKPGAGVCPVRGHSNVQGDRTVGITSHPSRAFLEKLGAAFDFEPPQTPGLDTVGAIEALRDGHAEVFVGLGGNFALATPDTQRTWQALRRCKLVVQVSTTLNRSHLVVGQEAILLPCLGRTERDVQPSGPQFVSVEDSMSAVHRSEGRLPPASPALRSEPAIVAGLARAVLGSGHGVAWEAMAADYDLIRDRIAEVIPGFERFNERVRQDGGFVLPSGARTRRFETPSGRAHFQLHALPRIPLEAGQLILMSIRSHDQFNTTIYSNDDRYRGIRGQRRVLLIHRDDLEERGLHPEQRLDITSHFGDEERTVRAFRAVPYEIPRGCVAAYFPEANALVPLESMAEGSRTPAYKSVVISLAPTR